MTLSFAILEPISLSSASSRAIITSGLSYDIFRAANDDSIPGIDVTAASAIIAEIGTDLSAFPTAEHLCSWAGLSPGNNESAGKRKNTRIGKGNNYLKSMLCEISWVICGKRKLYLSGWYWRIKQHKGSKRAVVALARKLLSIIYTMFKTGQPYNEDCFEQRRKQCEQKRTSRMINELTKPGFKVEPII